MKRESALYGILGAIAAAGGVHCCEEMKVEHFCFFCAGVFVFRVLLEFDDWLQGRE